MGFKMETKMSLLDWISFPFWAIADPIHDACWTRKIQKAGRKAGWTETQIKETLDLVNARTA